jgi:hypothetical protein
LVEFDFGVESTDARHKMARTNHLLDWTLVGQGNMHPIYGEFN